MMAPTESSHIVQAGFNVRDATIDDVDDLTKLWYTSFNPSHPFWDIMTPDNEATRRWWREAWTMGIQAGPDVLRTFVVEDLSRNRELVAFARWNVPQTDGKQDIPLPPYLDEWDAELTEAFWEGMPKNRRDVMGQKPHWMLEFLGVSQLYQSQGLGYTLVNWGCHQADVTGYEVYLDATIKGLPFYKKHFGFQHRKPLSIPTRPDTFGEYELMAVVRPARPAIRSGLSPAKKGVIDVDAKKHLVKSTVVEIIDVI